MVLLINSGVPQESSPSFVLFSIFKNDLLQLKLNSNVCGYAGNIKIFGNPGFLLQQNVDLIVC